MDGNFYIGSFPLLYTFYHSLILLTLFQFIFYFFNELLFFFFQCIILAISTNQDKKGKGNGIVKFMFKIHMELDLEHFLNPSILYFLNL